jgi:hypothetical protein
MLSALGLRPWRPARVFPWIALTRTARGNERGNNVQSALFPLAVVHDGQTLRVSSWLSLLWLLLQTHSTARS